MRKWTLVLMIILLFSFNNVSALEINYRNTYHHWAVPYASNLSQRLIPVRKAAAERSDISVEDIDSIRDEVLNEEHLNEHITFVNWQKMLKIILGAQTDEVYSHKGNITRENAVVSMMKILNTKYEMTSSGLNAMEARDKFNDSIKAVQDTMDLLGLAYSKGIISGYDDSSFRPKDYLKNSEAIAIIERVCSKFGLPETQWHGNIELLSIDGFLRINGPEAVEEAFWTNDKGILLIYSIKDSNVRQAAKVFIDENRIINAFEYDNRNLTESLFNENAFREERGYLSINKIIWNKDRRYVNIKGEMKSIYIPYVNYSVSDDNRMVLMQDEEERAVRVFDFLTEKSFVLDKYYRWADEQYDRGIKWSPDSRYIISTLFKPEDDIGIEEKNRFAIFDCRSGNLIKVINDPGYYSFYPVWSADGSKIAFYRVKIDDESLKGFLDNSVDSKFDLLAREIGIYDVKTGEVKYYPHPDSIIFAKYQNGLIWSPQGDSLYVQIAADKEKVLNDINQDVNTDINQITNDVWSLNVGTGSYTKELNGDARKLNEESEKATQSEKEDISVFNPLGDGAQDDVYTMESNVKSVSSNGKLVLYEKQPYNLSRYENIPPQYILKNLETGEEKGISNMLLTDHWWLSDGSLLLVESELVRSRYAAQTTYSIKKIKPNFEEIELAELSQYPTSISLSPDKNYLMLYQYRGSKDVKIIDLNK
ncbi:S-layer homology domain-containing protein [Petroclostridium sp. X23]|uniref:S-layer homology domain-containing protein n=1 Tax=Petroclostridium sp. X23 TaxID=3045146 RepID=UPI0024AD75E8|nr:S-layer homology domain-containing protein [Petroclostridium sp. X23]WHH61393.1 hypothetical protein QKW49_12125 [Petroclostridium sp. X23]